LASSSASGASLCVNYPCWLYFPASHVLIFLWSFSRLLILLLLLISGLHPNPGPPSSSSAPLPIILQLNCNGLRNSIAEIDSFLRSERISVAALQETFLLTSSFPPNFPGYNLIRRDHPQGRGGGLAFLVHHSVPFTPIDTLFFQDDHTKCQAIKVTINNSELAIFNVYLPPVSSCPRNYKPDLDPVFLHADDNVLMCGDFNAHHEGWHSSLSDSRGELIADQIEDSPLIALNLDTPTRLPSSGSPTSSDITLASAHIALAATWLTHVRLNSDHLPITISLPSDGAPPLRAAKSYVNF
jgi:hypothetical protein